jgi:hypothetical protein
LVKIIRKCSYLHRFLRWKAFQDAAFIDTDGKEKIWNEHRVSEDFDMALRSVLDVYLRAWNGTYCHQIIVERIHDSACSSFFMLMVRWLTNECRWATYANSEFKEGVSLTIDDELNRWQKYAYGGLGHFISCDNLMVGTGN